MNRIILIGNGFDLAHGLKTSYKNFIDDYWKEVANGFTNGNSLSYDDEFVELTCNVDEYPLDLNKVNKVKEEFKKVTYYYYLKYMITECNKSSEFNITLSFKNKLLEVISEKLGIENWVDVEIEYYDQLKKICIQSYDKENGQNTVEKYNEGAEFQFDKYILRRKVAIEKLNKYLYMVKRKLEEYLIKAQIKDETEDYRKADDEIKKHLSKLINPQEVSINGQVFVRRELLTNNFYNTNTLLLNFNYTDTAQKLYEELNTNDKYDIINIHGELDNTDNPMIFGYGNEIDDEYKMIEKLGDNEFLKGMKSYQYGNTANYHRLLNFAYSAPYQVYIMGHSCGLSDRLLLNMLFENENCVSIKPFYWQHKPDKNGKTDDYNDIYINISRNFNDKSKMRARVVDKTKCVPLVPIGD